MTVIRKTLAFFLATTLLALSGCKDAENVVARDLWRPEKETNEQVVLHVYLDRSASSLPNRAKMGQQLVDLIDLYPESLRTTIYWFSDRTSKIKTVFCSRQESQRVVEEFVTDQDSRNTEKTYLSRAIDDLTRQCDREPEKKNIGIFVTDGGFDEDSTALTASVKQLSRRENSSMIVFVGLSHDGTDRLSKLDTYVKDPYTQDRNKQYFDIALDGNEKILTSARSAVMALLPAPKVSAEGA